MPPEQAEQTRRSRLIVPAALAVVALAAIAAMVIVLAKSSHPSEIGRPSQGQGEPPHARPTFFAASSFWNRQLPADAALDPASTSLVASFNNEINREKAQGIGPWIQTDEASTPLYTVPANQPKVPVKLDTGPWGAQLAAVFAAGVPIPPNAHPAAGPDRHMTVYQPSSDTLWEFYHASKQANGWHAEWGGAIQHVSSSPGYYTPAAWPGRSRENWGASATSLPIVGGTILMRELKRGRIDHALALDIPFPRHGVFSWPAQRSDGRGGPETLPEGARMRIDPKVDLDKLGLPRPTLILARAAQRYGMIVRDGTHHATAFYAEDPTPTGHDPYGEPGGFWEGKTPAWVLAKFPWDHLQVLKMSLCTAAPCAQRDSP